MHSIATPFMLALTLCAAQCVVLADVAPATSRQINAQPTAGPAANDIAASGPAQVVRAMFDAFAKRSPEGYVEWMSEDFLFTSNDPAFLEAHPRGTTRLDELRFARNLFGLSQRSETAPLPHALEVNMALGPIVTLEHASAREAFVVVEHMLVELAMSDASRIDLGAASHALDLVRTTDGWRVRRWREIRAEHGVATVLAQGDAGPGDASAAPAPGPEIVLALSPRVERGNSAIAFDVALPAPGGQLEMFDVTGRRVDARDLRGLPRGRHRVVLDGASRAPGIYWARLRQPGVASTAKVVWVK